jgi:hypothetical protein
MMEIRPHLPWYLLPGSVPETLVLILVLLRLAQRPGATTGF